ncbi:MAG TPA: deoxyribodipyrimidine photo-lyase [Xanthomonadaceae bacterium]|nr:deoxyribodipyrimidine photo-lyase [Xanthomonadaceae bacterium]
MERALVWFRRDLRVADNPALWAALAAGYVPVPVYVHAPEEEAPWVPGAASRAWLERSLLALSEALRQRGSGLVVVRGPSLDALRESAQACGARAAFWNRLHEPAARARDAGVERGLRAAGVTVTHFDAGLWCEPSALKTADGRPYRVFTAFWRKLAPGLETLAPPAPAPRELPPLPAGLRSESVRALGLRPRPRWDRAFWDAWEPGEAGAHERLQDFLADAVAGYGDDRDRPDRDGTSGLSPHLHFGEISPRQCLQAVREQAAGDDRAGAMAFLRELAWREFGVHLLHHFPKSTTQDFDARMRGFAWAEPDDLLLEAWRRGHTGVPMVDAGMRQLWERGWMHNRVRMIVASFLCKNLRMHWRQGAAWFWDTLVDADLASNTLGWQWTAGTGADAAPYFRVFNPVTQGRRFDPDGAYVRRWVPELKALPSALVHAPWAAPERLAELAPRYPRQPIVDLKASREAALGAYAALKAR